MHCCIIVDFRHNVLHLSGRLTNLYIKNGYYKINVFSVSFLYYGICPLLINFGPSIEYVKYLKKISQSLEIA